MVIINKQYWVYILASKRNVTLYCGVSSDLIKRVWQHKNDVIDGFTKKYQVKRLVYFEAHQEVQGALDREKRIKKWKRDWKLRLIEEKNPEWRDLYDQIAGNPESLSSIQVKKPVSPKMTEVSECSGKNQIEIVPNPKQIRNSNDRNCDCTTTQGSRW